MHRNQNHHVNNGNAQRRVEGGFIRPSLRQHIKQKWMSTALGVIGLVAGIFLIVGNEANAVQISKSLEESISLVTSVSPDAEIDKSNIGKIIYLSGVMTIHEPLTEPEYGISVLAVKLLRQVQMYQWVETERNIYDGGGQVITTDYYYHTDWQTRLIDSSSFATPMGHRNPKEFPVKHQTQINEKVRVGNYNLGLELKKKFTDFEPLTSDERPERKDIKLHAGLYYHCQDIWKPEIGDIRIQFSYAGQQGQQVTIVALLDKTNTLVPYPSKLGVEVLLLRKGYYSLEDLFSLEYSENKFFTWVFRGAGWLLLYLSCISLTTILQILVAHSVFLQEILPISHSSLKMTVSMCMSLVVTALAWVWYRPVLGIGLIVATVILLFCTKWFSNEQSGRGQYNRL